MHQTPPLTTNDSKQSISHKFSAVAIKPVSVKENTTPTDHFCSDEKGITGNSSS
jgi:hypothetical protein